MSNRLLLKKSSVAARVPLSTDLEFGEIAINYADGKLYYKNSSSVITSFTASATVSSVALSLPAIFTVTGSPVTTSGTLTATLATQTANTVFAAPNGSSGSPTFRALVSNDLPSTYAPAGTLTLGTSGQTTTMNGNISAITSNQTITLSPIGASGTVTIAPGTLAGSINNMVIGSTTPAAGTFTALTANGAITLTTTTNNQIYSTTSTGVISISSGTTGSIDNMTIGGTTPAVVNFSKLVNPTSAVSSTAWTTSGINIVSNPRTYTDTSSIAGTVAASYINTIGSPTFASTNAITITDAVNLYVNAPSGSANSTLTNAWAIYAAGRIRASDFTGTIGATTTNTGAFTTLSASSTVSGAGFSTYLASPPAIGGTAAAAGTFTQLTVNGSNLNTSISPTGSSTVTLNPAGVLTLSTANTTAANSSAIGISSGTTTTSGTTGAVTLNSGNSTATSGNVTISTGTGVTSGTLSLDTGAGSTTTGGINIGTGANAKTITIGNTSGATTLTVNTGTGGVTFNNVASGQVKVAATAAPTVDLFNITNTGFATTTANANGLHVTYIGGAAAVESSANRIDITPGTTTGGTWNAYRAVVTTDATTGVSLNGLKLDTIASPGTGTSNALYVGTGWDNIINYNGTILIDGSGNLLLSTNAAISAAGTTQGTGTALTKNYNIITTVAASSGVVLPTATVGRTIIIVNKGANSLAVYPASGGTIDALSSNASISVPVSGMMSFYASSTTQWYSSYNTTTSAGGGTTYTTGYVPYGNGTSTLTTSANLFFDGTNLGIGTTSPSVKLQTYNNTNGVAGIMAKTGAAATSAIELQDSAATPNRWWLATGLGTTTDGVFSIYDKTLAIPRLVIDKSSNVGIGTSTPNNYSGYTTLTVGGATSVGDGCIDINYSNGTYGIEAYVQKGPTTADDLAAITFNNSAATVGTYSAIIGYYNATASFYTIDASPLTFGTNNVEAIRIDTSGNVGIGTSPNYKLEVLGNAIVSRSPASNSYTLIEAQAYDYVSTPSYTGTALFQYDHTATGTVFGLSTANLGILRFQNGSAGLIYSNAGPIVFGMGTSEVARINNDGNIGIGTTVTSGSKVTIADTSSSPLFIKSSYSGLSSVTSASTSATGIPGFSLSSQNPWTTSKHTGEIRFDGLTTASTYTVYASILTISETNTSTGAPTALVFSTSDGTSQAPERMRIDYLGNVGIGTSSPSYYGKLAVIGTSGTQNAASFGTAVNPSAAYFFSTDGGATDLVLGGTGSNNTSGFITTQTAIPLLFGTTQTERMRIHASGGVSIGNTTDPGIYNLSVTGSIRATSGTTVWQSSANIPVTNGLSLGATAKALTPAGGNVGVFGIYSDDATNQFQGSISLITDPTATNRRLRFDCVEQSIAYRHITFQESGGNVGIGIATPSYLLDVARATVGGITATRVYNSDTSTTSSANLYLVTGGGVTLAAYAYGTTAAYIGASSNHPLVLLSNGAEHARVHASGGVSIGNTTDPGNTNLSVTGTILGAASPSTTVSSLTLSGTPNVSTSSKTGVLGIGPNLTAADKNLLLSAVQNINDYSQIIVQNTNAGTAASADIVINNNNTTGAGIYLDLGINSSGFTGTGSFNAANASYVYSNGGDLVIGTQTANIVRFVIGSATASDSGTITSTGLNTFPIGATTASTGAFTTLSASSTVSGTGFSTYLASPPAIGGTAAAAGSFTTLSANGVITHNTTTNSQSYTTSGAGTITITSGTAGNINNMNIGATTAGTGAFTTLSASSTVSGTGFSTYLASPPAIGGTTAAAGTFTTLSATSNAVGSVTAASGGKTSVTAVTGSLTLATGGVTLASQVMAANSSWRITAYGTYAAASSANARTLTMSCYWGATALTSVTTGNVLASTAQTTPWKVELEITGSSATAAWCTGFLSAQVTSATIPLNYVATAASVTGLTTTSTIDFRVGQTGTATSTDTINVHSVILERID